MTRLTLFLALATAWCADAVLMFGLAEARWGSIMYRLFAGILLLLALIALTVAIGPQGWRVIRPQMLRAFDRLSVGLWAYWRLAKARYATRRTVTPAHLATHTR